MLAGDVSSARPFWRDREANEHFQGAVENLKDVIAIDSSGLGQMISAYASVNNGGGVIKMLNAQSRVHDLLTVTKLYSVFESFDDEAKALTFS